jgi:signal transduction histidine kinase
VNGVYVQQQRAERLIAAARTLLAIVSVVVMEIDPDVAFGRTHFAVVVAGCYAVYCAAEGLRVWSSPLQSLRARVVTHAIDLAVYSVLLYVTQTPVSPFATLFFFSLFCATLRFTTQGIVWTGVIAASQITIAALLHDSARSDPAFLVTRLVYTVIATLLLAYLREYQQRMQEDLSHIALWPRSASRQQREALVRDVLRAAAELLRARRSVLVWEENDEPWFWLAYYDGTTVTITREPPDLGIVAEFAEGKTFFTTRGGEGMTLIASDGGKATTVETSPIAPALMMRFAIDSVISAPVEGEESRGRILLLDCGHASYDDLVLCGIGAQLVATQLDESVLFERVRDAAVSEERLRLARDLHDGLLQSLTAARLQLERVHHLIRFNAAEAQQHLREVQEMISHDQSDLRAFITQLRPRSIAPQTLPLHTRLSSLADRIAQQWDVAVEMSLDPPYVHVTDGVASEIFSLVAESLANAAKHARARSIQVAVAVDGTLARIRVSDNGRGFPFRGTYDLAQLDAMHRGPVTLRERVASLHGTLVLDSSPSGATIAITVPM